MTCMETDSPVHAIGDRTKDSILVMVWYGTREEIDPDSVHCPQYLRVQEDKSWVAYRFHNTKRTFLPLLVFNFFLLGLWLGIRNY